MKTLDKILVIIGVFLFVFIVIMVITFWKFQAIPDTLCTCVLGSGLGEAIICGAITIVKKKYKVEEDDEEEDLT